MLLAEERNAIQLSGRQGLPTLHPGDRLKGYLRLSCQTDTLGNSRLSRKAFRSPIHISKPYRYDRSLLLNVMSPTAGLLAGDSIDIDVEVCSQSSLILSSPAALRIHKMDAGSAALSQQFHVASVGLLEVNPEWLILQGESDFSQKTQIEVEKDGSLFFIESIAPGRVAHKETFEFHRFRNRFKLMWDNVLVGLERYVIEPQKGTHGTWQKAFKTPFYVSIFIIANELAGKADLERFIRNLNTSSLLAGASRLTTGPSWNVKLLTEDPVEARAAIDAIRTFFYEKLGRKAPPLRR